MVAFVVALAAYFLLSFSIIMLNTDQHNIPTQQPALWCTEQTMSSSLFCATSFSLFCGTSLSLFCSMSHSFAAHHSHSLFFASHPSWFCFLSLLHCGAWLSLLLCSALLSLNCFVAHYSLFFYITFLSFFCHIAALLSLLLCASLSFLIVLLSFLKYVTLSCMPLSLSMVCCSLLCTISFKVHHSLIQGRLLSLSRCIAFSFNYMVHCIALSFKVHCSLFQGALNSNTVSSGGTFS